MSDEHRRFKAQVLRENIQKLQIIGYAGFAINGFLLFLSWKTRGTEGLGSLDSLVRIIWIIATFLFLYFSRFTKTAGAAFYAAASLCLLFSALITVNFTEHAGYTYIYIINALLIGAFMHISLPAYAGLVLPGLGVLLFGVFSQDLPWHITRGLAINGTAITLFGGALSRYTLGIKQAQFTAETRLREANQLLAAQVNQDGLTGLPNRRKLDEQVDLLGAQLSRRPIPFAVIMMDVDLFKLYNDTYGHLAGDDALRLVAEVLTLQVRRETDMAGRFGGEEFLILLSGPSFGAAREIAEGIRQGILQKNLPHRSTDQGVLSASFGVAWKAVCSREDLQALIRLADACLYEAKLAGRNRVVSRDMSF